MPNARGIDLPAFRVWHSRLVNDSHVMTYRIRKKERTTVLWRLIKLEHAPTDRFPNGSAARGYLLRLPLRSNGHIDHALHDREPRQCTARRFWPNEPEHSGYIVREESNFSIIEKEDVSLMIEWARFHSCAFEQDKKMEIAERANGAVPLRVTSIRPD